MVLSASDYYPFGMSMPDRKYTGGGYRYGFNGKETDSETELNDFGARFYGANIGRWLSVDPLEYEFPSTSPYIAFNNNPLVFVDPTGMAPDWHEETDAQGKKTIVADANDNAYTLNKFLGDKYHLNINWNQAEWNNGKKTAEDPRMHINDVYNIYVQGGGNPSGNVSAEQAAKVRIDVSQVLSRSDAFAFPVDGQPELAATHGPSCEGGSGYKGATFGMTRSGGTQMHGGTDVKGNTNAPAYAIRPGKVVSVNNAMEADEYFGKKSKITKKGQNMGGNCIKIETTDGAGNKIVLAYKHLNRVDVKEGQIILAGQQIGLVGNTGNAGIQKGSTSIGICNTHIHIEAIKGGVKVNPEGSPTGMKFNIKNGQFNY